MEIPRKEFLRLLAIIDPAIAIQPIAPITSYVWFTGSRMMAYNDVISISVPMPTNFKGAVPGKLLISTLESSGGKDAKLEMTDKHAAELHVGRTTLKLPVLLPEAFLFKMPTMNKERPITKDHSLFECLSDCLIAVGTEYTDANQLGVTLIQKEADVSSGLSAFATNRVTLVSSKVKGKSGIGGLVPNQRILLPTSFCEQALSLRDDGMHVEFTRKYALLWFSKSKTMLWSRYIQNDKPIDFFAALERILPPGTPQMIPVPRTLPAIIKRALLVAEDSKTQRTKISINSSRALFVTQSERGVMHDTASVPDHDDVVTTIMPKRLKAMSERFDKMLVTKECVAMKNSRSTFIAASISS